MELSQYLERVSVDMASLKLLTLIIGGGLSEIVFS